ncbi:MAG: SDR family NAD(P)-dependent oxidoreductase [Myxococcales bacterium]|nr:SDR family NAD(P)-dependent oxidoreductase [Myxococcales bacterium]
MQGKVALVTGASSGIGLAVAKKLAQRGAKVALVARGKANLEEAAREVARAGGGAEGVAVFPLDVADLTALEALPAAVVGKLGRLDVVVNNAGVNHRGAIQRHTAAKLAEVITVNLTAPVVLTRAAVPFLERGGSVVAVASIAGMVPVPGEAAYSASKAGIRAFCRAIADDLAAADVHSGVVCPGPVDTGFFGDVSEVPNLVFSQPMSSADEVADAVLRCIDERLDEVAIPAQSGRLATVAYLAPSFARRIRPMLEKRGRAAKAAYIASRARK